MSRSCASSEADFRMFGMTRSAWNFSSSTYLLWTSVPWCTAGRKAELQSGLPMVSGSVGVSTTKPGRFSLSDPRP